MKVEVAILGSPSLIVLIVSVDVKQLRAQQLCESRGGRPGFPVPNKPTVSVDVKQHFNNDLKQH